MKIKQFVLACLAVCTIVVLSGCNTVHGVGADVKSLGQGVENAVK